MGEESNKPRDLENRLIDFAVTILRLADKLPNTKAGRHIGGQLVRSGTSAAPNYGEAQSAESRRDFIHKMKIAQKELRETLAWLKIIVRASICDPDEITVVINECDELISIFVASVRTADANRNS